MTFLTSTLKKARKNKRLTLKQVSQKTGISISFLSDIERGKTNPSQKTFKKLTDFYGIDIQLTLDLDMDSRTLENLNHTLIIMRGGKPNDRSEKDRRYSIAITELEKVYAYFKTFVLPTEM